MSTDRLPFRQIHLDFHTSEKIEGIGADFDADEFADTLAKAHVNSINLFARGHHGWIYYDTKAFPERRHPHLACNLLKEQVEACQKRGIKTPIYVTVQADRYTGTRHPEWAQIGADGHLRSYSPINPGFAPGLCLNTPYFDFLKAFIDDVFECIPVVDGVWMDIVGPQQCLCRRCMEGMLAKGLEPSEPEDVKAFGWEVVRRFMTEMTRHVHAHKPDCLVYYNNGHVGPHNRPTLDAFTHFELESMPSYGGYGYLHFPATARYARTLGFETIGMTAKFHRLWGDFHSFKNKAALEFEAYRTLAMGSKCCVGDQLLPGGRLCAVTYDLIGSVYAEVEKKEPWCRGARAVSEIGLLTPEEFTYTGRPEGTGMPRSIWGAVRMLQETPYQFDVIDSESDWSPYKLLILPDDIPVDERYAKLLEDFAAKGGAVIATGRSGLAPDGSGFASDLFGVSLKGEAPYQPDFLMPSDRIGRGLPKTEHAVYERALEVEALEGAEVLADVRVPLFNRSYRHFCSHAHAPSSGKVGYPGIVRKGQVIYFAHPHFTQYYNNALLWCKKFIVEAIDLLLPDSLIRWDAPSTAQVALNAQPEENRWIVHLLHYIPERRGQESDVIEDVIPIFNVAMSVKTDKPVREVACVPGGEKISFEQESGRIGFTVPKVDGHQMIAITFA